MTRIAGFVAVFALAAGWGAWSVADNLSDDNVLTDDWLFLADCGAPFGQREGHWRFGWNRDKSGQGVDADNPRSPNERYDRFLPLEAGDRWELALPEGKYLVTIVAGGPDAPEGAVHKIAAEGVPVVDGEPSADCPWVAGSRWVEVKDGALTVAAGAGAKHARIATLRVRHPWLAPEADSGPVQAKLPIQIDVGGPCCCGFLSDREWTPNASHGFVGCYDLSDPKAIVNWNIAEPFLPYPVTDTKVPEVFQYLRVGQFDYRVRVPDGVYDVDLLLVDHIKRHFSDAGPIRKMAFAVKAEGGPERVIDVAQTAKRAHRAAVATLEKIAVRDGVLDLNFECRPNPKERIWLAGLVVRPAGQEPKWDVEGPHANPLQPYDVDVRVAFGPPRKTVKPSANRYLAAGQRFLDAMIEYASDRNDEGQNIPTGMFFVQVDLGGETPKPLTDRMDPNDLPDVDKALCLLSHYTGHRKYAEHFERSLNLLVRNYLHSGGFVHWGEAATLSPGGWAFGAGGGRAPENDFAFQQAERAARMNPQGFARWAESWWRNAMGNKNGKIGDWGQGIFNRHAFPGDATRIGSVGHEYPRHAGFYMLFYGHGYDLTHKEAFLGYLNYMMDFYDDHRGPQGGYVFGGYPAAKARNNGIAPQNRSSTSIAMGMTVDGWEATRPTPGEHPLRQRFDRHCLANDGGVLGYEDLPMVGPAFRGYVRVSCNVARTMFDRYRQLQMDGRPQALELAGRYRARVVATADRYRELIGRAAEAEASDFGNVILLMLAARSLTGKDEYVAGPGGALAWADKGMELLMHPSGLYATAPGRKDFGGMGANDNPCDTFGLALVSLGLHLAEPGAASACRSVGR